MSESRIIHQLDSRAVRAARLDYLDCENDSFRVLTVYLKKEIPPEELEFIARLVVLNSGLIMFRVVKPGQSIEIENFNFGIASTWGYSVYSPDNLSGIRFVTDGQSVQHALGAINV